MSAILSVIDVLFVITGNISVVMIIWGGVQYGTSGGDCGRSRAAKDTIVYAVTGLATLVIAVSIIKVALPALVPLSGRSSIGFVPVTVLLWGGVGLVATGLRWLRRLPRWIGVISALCLPKSERRAHAEEIWAALLEEPSLVKRTQMAVTAVMAAPRSGWFARKRRQAERAEWFRLA